MSFLKKIHRVSYVLFVICLLNFFGLSDADPTVKETTKYYKVNGSSAGQVRKNMTAKSPIVFEGKKFDAYTKWDVSWNFFWEEGNDICSITSVETTVTVSFTFPKWIDYYNADVALQQQWDQYMEALVEHEHGHKNIGVAAAEEIEEELLEIDSFSTCSQLERAANKRGHEIINKYVDIEKEYDKKTNHGMNTGAVFP